ncbi:hypothetical protein ABZ618_29985 [Streptomyces roseolus]|uniref:hypothetical protein n=1 Tax=Streptomyces roseolus TaxID=67358 RepID=UPI0033C11B6B
MSTETDGFAAPQDTAGALVAEERRLRDPVRELALQVSPHPFWTTLEGLAVVEACARLKHHPKVLPDAV